uniref:NADH-cytochrome b5 reductase n=1 Tax=Helicotheca tamesis TaxID=374047 RepID=A0A7S2E1S6_9STRA|mmetsp:Transcript_11829/g.16353  ORF Transcript_11829/g.16353 Transcript_11829/m.16353 type:complete len:308 (+) Transcript_11829:97-1020(+)|eukprot:CAMPEP_0185737704 /NCGR_PEP_ID=MMETSP1171-20130828/31076_1 /TAXON_ID=374046 /ORGANISM="Helicotheca tamensis, Strain CCMP826" /LENGTH=307 /DNA_ID=CAMNT_0028408699 /DNA_START=27 /DNA_END=953 /DNA_ORIENTATION=+
MSAIVDSSSPDALMYLVTSVLATAVMIGIYVLKFSKPKTALNPDEWIAFPLIEKKSISHDTRTFTFGLPTETTILGLPIGQHISFRYKGADGKMIQRTYTPVSGDETPGKVLFTIKVYKAGVHPKFPDGGKMSQHLDSLEIGDTIEMKGPKGHMTYLGQGKMQVKVIKKPLATRTAKHIGMIAGGTGITPMLQIIHAALRDPKDSTKMSIIFANQTEDDILVRKELEEAAKEYPDRFKLHYTLDRPPANWKYSEGFVCKEMIEKHLPPPAADGSTQIFMCGPSPMVKFACLPALGELGYKDTDYFVF